MSKFHASIRDILEDVHHFLLLSLQKEALSNCAVSHKESLLTRLKTLDSEYPELQLNFHVSNETHNCSTIYPPSSPIPYVDMNGGSPYKMPCSLSTGDTNNYDICILKEKYESVESQSITESEDYISEEAKNLPEIAASDLYACEKSGYLDKKKRESIKGWLNPFQKRWCAIKDGVLYYYEKTTDRKQKGCIILSGYEVRALAEDSKEGRKYNYCFELVCPGRRTYQFSAPSEKDLQQWIVAVEHNNQSSSSGKTMHRESSTSRIVNETDSVVLTSDHDLEDIYEIVDEEESVVKEEKKDQRDCISEGSVTVCSVEDVNQEHIFNFSEWYVGLWDCSASDASELSFCRGDLIHILNKEHDHYSWWVGESNGKVGFVPKSYLMEAYEAC